MNMKTVNTVEQIKKNSCTGCGLCAEICPSHCISMVEDEEGFRFPKIDSLSCIGCSKCFNMCPTTSIADKLYGEDERKYFCGTISDKSILINSSSGGVFGILAENILNMGGYVCGCIYNDDVEAVHVLSNDKAEIEKMYGSKYVQSRAEHCYEQIENLLKKNVYVLFTGTACQVAALRLYLGKDYLNLFCVEILCHGVPSPKFFKSYVSYLEKNLKGEIKEVRFRDKRKDGWGSEHRMCVIYEKDSQTMEYRPKLPAYFSSFFYGLNLRESCYNCRFATSQRVADLTIGDFWGYWSKFKKRFEEGISVVCINTPRGHELVKNIEDKFDFFEILTEQEAIKSNDNFTHPIKRPTERTNFYKRIYQKGYKHSWKYTYFSRTYSKKALASVYGAFVPAKVRFALQTIRNKRR